MKLLYPQAGRQRQSQTPQAADASGITATTPAGAAAAGTGGGLELKRSPSCSPPTQPTQPPELSAASPMPGCPVSEEELQLLVELQHRRVAERNAEQERAQLAHKRRIQQEQRAHREVALGGGCCAFSQSPRTVTSKQVARAQRTNRGHLKHRQEKPESKESRGTTEEWEESVL